MDLVIGSISDAVFVTDSGERVIFANQYFADLLAVPRVFLYGKCLTDVFDVNLDKKTTDEFGYSNSHDEVKIGVYSWKTNSGVMVFKISSRTLPTNNQTVYLAQDISQDKELSDMKSSFTNLASHQLRTPMTSIMLQTHMLKDMTNFAEDSQEAVLLTNIIRASERMISLISDILSITRIQNNSAAYSKWSPIEINEQLRALRKELQPSAQEKSIELEFALPKERIKLNSNKAAINEIISNLLVNAIQYTPEHGSVCLRVKKTTSEITFEIQDTGIGIPKEMIPYIFDQFIRADNAFAVHNEGTGLGLYLVRMLTLQLGGTIACESELHKGTRFTIRLPVAPTE